MAAPLHFVKIYYKNHEEVLESGCWYFRQGAFTGVNTLLTDELAEEFRGLLGGMALALGSNVILYGVEINVPAQGNQEGPYTTRRNRNITPGGSNESYGDAYTYNIELSGLDQEGKLIKGGMRWAGIPNETVDCNVLNEAQRDLAKSRFDALFPIQVQLSDGTTYLRVIRTKVGTPDEDVVFATTLNVSNRVGIRSDRVLNRFAASRCSSGEDPGDPT